MVAGPEIVTAPKRTKPREPSPKLVLLAGIGGFALGIAAALLIAVGLDRPGAALKEARAQAESLRAERQKLEEQLGRSRDEASRLLDEKADLESSLVGAETDAQEARVQARQAAAAAAVTKEVFPQLGKLSRFRVKTLTQNLGQRSIERFDQLVAERVNTMGVPTTTNPAEANGVLIFMLDVARAQYHAAGSVVLLAATQDAEGTPVYLFADGDAIATDGDLFRDMLLSLDNMTLAFKKQWEGERQKLGLSVGAGAPLPPFGR